MLTCRRPTTVAAARILATSLLLALLGAAPLALAEDRPADPGQDKDTARFEGLSLEQLLDVRITTASKSSEKESDAPGMISVLTKDELTRFGGTTLRDILIRVPGLVGSSAYMTDRSIISARGDQLKTTSSHVLLLINGRPVREVLEGGIDSDIYQTFPVDVIERIEIIKGPGSVLYGSNAFSAIVNVITEKAHKNALAVTGLVGEAGAYAPSVKAAIRSGDLSIVAAGRYGKLADWESTYVLTAGSGARVPAHVTIPNKGPGAYLGVDYKDLRLISTFVQWDNSYFLGPAMALGGTRWKKDFADLGYGAKLGTTWQMDFDLGYTRSTFTAAPPMGITRDSYEVVAEWSNSVTLPKNSKATFGGLYSRQSGHEDASAGGAPIRVVDATQSSYALYAQVDYRPLQRLKLIGGLQANKAEATDIAFVPRVGVIWEVRPGFSVKALYSEAFRAPSIEELWLDHPALQGDPGLKPEKARTFDIGVSYQGKRAQARLTYYNTKQTNIIVPIPRGPTTVLTYTNLAEAKTNGVEVEGKYYVTESLYVSGSTLYHDTKDANGSGGVTPIPAFGAKAGISYQGRTGVTVSLFDVYQGNVDSSLRPSANVKPGPHDLLYLHCTLDVNKLLKLKGKEKLTVIIQGDNLLNKEVWLPAWGLQGAEQSLPYDQGRVAYLGIRASF